MLYKNSHEIKDAGFLKQIERALAKNGEMPEEIRFSVSFPFDHALAFIKRYERERLMNGTSKVKKSDLLAQMAWQWAHGIDIPAQDATALVPGLWRIPKKRYKGPKRPPKLKNPEETRGRKPKAREKQLDFQSIDTSEGLSWPIPKPNTQTPGGALEVNPGA